MKDNGPICFSLDPEDPSGPFRKEIDDNAVEPHWALGLTDIPEDHPYCGWVNDDNKCPPDISSMMSLIVFTFK